jgi:ribosomal protein L32
MAVPKRKSSKSRSGIDTFARNKRSVTQAVKTKDGKGIKRPHVDEYIKI